MPKKKKELKKGAFVTFFEGIAKEKKIDTDVVVEAIKDAFITAYTKKLENEVRDTFDKRNKKVNNKSKDGTKLSNALVRADIDLENNVLDFYHQYNVVREDDIVDDFIEISDEDPRATENNLKAGDVYEEKVNLSSFGKLDVDKFISVFKQHINAAEKEALHETFKGKIGEIVTGVVEKSDNAVIVNLSNSRDGAIATLYKKDLIGDEKFNPGDPIKVYIVSIGQGKSDKKDDLIKISRSHPGFLKKLFFNEIHEIYDGTVEIVDIARVSGVKSKVSVTTKDPNVDPSGACIGPNGSRIQAVVSQLGNKTKEKVDVITYKENKGLYIGECLKPVQIIGINFDDADNSATVVVPDEFKNQAIGPKGINAILTRSLLKLTNLKIIGETEAKEAGLEYKLFEQFEIDARNEAILKTREASLKKASMALASTIKEEEVKEDFLSKDEALDVEEEVINEINEEVKEVEKPIKIEESIEMVNVNTTISLNDLEASLEEEKKNTPETYKKKKKEVKQEEKQDYKEVSKEDRKPKEKMSIYTDEELEALENEDYDDEDLDDDSFEEYDDDSYYEDN